MKVTFHCLVVDVFSCEILRAYSRRNSKYYQSCMSMERPVESTLEPLAHFGPASRLHVSFSLSGQNPHFFTKSIHIADVSLCQRNPQVFGRLAVRTHYFRAMRGSSPSHRGMTILAYDLHQRVPADRWCVTYPGSPSEDVSELREFEVPTVYGRTHCKTYLGEYVSCSKAPETNPRYQDLAFLCREVCSALRCGQILPGPEDDASEAYGPSIYTVNEQYIKPVTQQAGKMSWALMRHPDGLDCELFISHAWQEGVFEFLAKVRHSWPRSMQTAWCCMLANPQNLDISSFLQSPKTSPFAVALEASKVMLVVPNRHQSVYTRLWCSYEAYLAQEDGKTILIAHSSNFLSGLMGFDVVGFSCYVWRG